MIREHTWKHFSTAEVEVIAQIARYHRKAIPEISHEEFKRLNAEGTTIIQVTHSDVNAAYGNRIIKLRDGWIVQ